LSQALSPAITLSKNTEHEKVNLAAVNWKRWITTPL